MKGIEWKGKNKMEQGVMHAPDKRVGHMWMPTSDSGETTLVDGSAINGTGYRLFPTDNRVNVLKMFFSQMLNLVKIEYASLAEKRGCFMVRLTRSCHILAKMRLTRPYIK